MSSLAINVANIDPTTCCIHSYSKQPFLFIWQAVPEKPIILGKLQILYCQTSVLLFNCWKLTDNVCTVQLLTVTWIIWREGTKYSIEQYYNEKDLIRKSENTMITNRVFPSSLIVVRFHKR